MKQIIFFLLFLINSISYSQGILHSEVVQGDSLETCNLVIWNFDNWEPTYHPFKIGTSTYLFPGEYKIAYLYKDKWLHSEWIHIGTNFMVIDKLIFVNPLPLTGITFMEEKNKIVIK